MIHPEPGLLEGTHLVTSELSPPLRLRGFTSDEPATFCFPVRSSRTQIVSKQSPALATTEWWRRGAGRAAECGLV